MGEYVGVHVHPTANNATAFTVYRLMAVCMLFWKTQYFPCGRISMALFVLSSAYVHTFADYGRPKKPRRQAPPPSSSYLNEPHSTAHRNPQLELLTDNSNLYSIGQGINVAHHQHCQIPFLAAHEIGSLRSVFSV